MTIIEFYDKDALETMAGALLCAPERVIFVGDNQKQMNRSIDKWKKVLADRNIATELLCRGVNKNNLWDIVELLTELVARFDDCVFDLTGGEDLYLVAVGIVLANSEGAVQCHRFNFRNDTVNDCDADGKVVRTGSFDITVDEQVALYGGEVVRDADREPSTYDWDFISTISTVPFVSLALSSTNSPGFSAISLNVSLLTFLNRGKSGRRVKPGWRVSQTVCTLELGAGTGFIPVSFETTAPLSFVKPLFFEAHIDGLHHHLPLLLSTFTFPAVSPSPCS